MNTEIKASVKSIKKILCDDEFFYQIPDYQRPYSWDKDNLSDLIEDLTDAYNNVNTNENYFCGSLVVVDNKKDNRYDVIDGQQRLTTFTILFCVLRDFFSNRLGNKSKDYITLSIQDKYNESNKKLKFLTSETYQNKFHQTVIDGIKDVKSDDNRYLQNAHLLIKFINERIKEDRIENIDKFTEWVFEKVVLTQIICPNQDTAIQIFNVLNDRGMALSSVDILKSTLMQRLSDENRKFFKANWERVKIKLENEDLSFENLFNIYLYYLKATNPKTTLHKELLSTFKNENSLKLIHKLEKFADSYIEVRKLENKYLYSLKYLRHTIYWESILTAAKFEKYSEFNKLIKLLVAYYYQNWIIGATVARIKQPSFNILKSLKRNDSIQFIEKILKDSLNKYSTTNEYLKVIDSSNIYELKWTKPVLLLLEYFSKDDSNQSFIALNKKIEVEHILPVTIDDKYGWQNVFTEEKRVKLTNSLGNLTLLSKRKNIQARNYAFSEKKKAYEEKDNLTTSLKLTTDVALESKWTCDEIVRRQKKLIKKLNKILIFDASKDSIISEESVDGYESISTLSSDKNSSVLNVLDEASVKLNGRFIYIKRFSDNSIFIFDENENQINEKVKPILREINKHYKLKVDIHHTTGSLKVTRTLGKDIINRLNEVKEYVTVENLQKNQGIKPVNRLIDSVGVVTFVKYFKQFSDLYNEKTTKNKISELFGDNLENWSDTSIAVKINGGLKIFTLNRELEAIEYIINVKKIGNIPNGIEIKKQAESIRNLLKRK